MKWESERCLISRLSLNIYSRSPCSERSIVFPVVLNIWNVSPFFLVLWRESSEIKSEFFKRKDPCSKWLNMLFLINSFGDLEDIVVWKVHVKFGGGFYRCMYYLISMFICEYIVWISRFLIHKEIVCGKYQISYQSKLGGQV